MPTWSTFFSAISFSLFSLPFVCVCACVCFVFSSQSLFFQCLSLYPNNNTRTLSILIQTTHGETTQGEIVFESELSCFCPSPSLGSP